MTVSDFYDYEGNPEGLTKGEMAAMRSDDGGGSSDANEFVEGRVEDDDGSPATIEGEGAADPTEAAEQAVEEMLHDEDADEDEPDDEPVTYSQEEYDKIVRQRDALARSKQDFKKRGREERERVEGRIDKLNDAIESFTKRDEPEPEALTPEQRIEAQNDRILSELADLKKSRDEDRDISTASAAASSVHDFATGAQAQHVAATKQTAETFNAKLKAVRVDIYEDKIDEGLDDDAAMAALNEWELNLITRAAKSGDNPAAMIEQRFNRRRLTADGVAVGEEAKGGKAETGSVAARNMARVKAGQKVASTKGSKRVASGMVRLTYDSLNKMSRSDREYYLDKITGTDKEDDLDLKRVAIVPIRGQS